jgi:uncharacterized protein YcbX
VARVAEIRRHPVKSVGWEALESAALAPGEAMPFDRTWAVAHGASRFPFDAPVWTECEAFLRVANAPRLAQVRARWADGRLSLTHPDAPALEADPDDAGGAQAIADWAGALANGIEGPFRLARARQALTDTDYPTVSIKSLASLRALSQRMGTALDAGRFRGNFWLDDLAPWEEAEWPGRTLRVGGALLRVVERVGRCAATEANPATGRRDAAVRRALHEAQGEADFGVYAEVLEGGVVRVGDPVSLG